jgi:hypothetical protein
VASAWGQAEFQGGRDVRNLSYTYSYMGRSPGPPHGPSLGEEQHTTSTWEEASIKASKLDQADGTAASLSYLGSDFPFSFMLVPLSCV